MRIGVRGCSTAIARMLTVAVKTVATPTNSLSAVLWRNDIGRLHSLHLTVTIFRMVSVPNGTVLSTIYCFCCHCAVVRGGVSSHNLGRSSASDAKRTLGCALSNSVHPLSRDVRHRLTGQRRAIRKHWVTILR